MEVLHGLARVDELDSNMSSRMDAAISKGLITCHSMREFDVEGNSPDGAQDLNFWMRNFEDVITELVGDERFVGHQYYRFEVTRNSAGERVLGRKLGRQMEQCHFKLRRIR